LVWKGENYTTLLFQQLQVAQKRLPAAPRKRTAAKFRLIHPRKPLLRKNGNPVVLDGIDFVRIYTAVNQNSGWMGEISTELQAVEDLHFKK